MKKRMFVLLCGLVGLMLALTAAPVMAQGAPLADGSGLGGTIDATTPFQFYSVTMNEGDLVSLRVTSLTPGMLPTLSISSPAGQQLAFSSGDPTSIAAGSARIDLRSEQTGTFNVQVGSSNSGTGQFVITANIIQSSEVVVLTTPTVLQFSPQQTVIAVTIAQNLESALDFAIVGDENRLYVAMHGADGSLLSVNIVEGTLTTPIEPGSGVYTAIITNPAASSASVDVTAILSTGVGSSGSSDGAAAPPPATNGDVCTVTTGEGGTNLRTGPGTNYGVITSLPANTSYTATGQNSGWYTIDYNGQTGWLAGFVTAQTGPCNTLPLAEAPPAPEGPANPPPPATTEEATGGQPTSAPGQSTTAPGQATQPPVQPTSPPPTEAPAQVAPPDSSFFVDVSVKNGQATVSDAVSYPDGDTQDEIFWNIIDFDSVTTAGDLEVIITCTGTGTENVTFFSGGSNFSCGDIISRIVTNDSDSGLIRVTAVSGTGTLVNYSLLFRGTPR